VIITILTVIIDDHLMIIKIIWS